MAEGFDVKALDSNGQWVKVGVAVRLSDGSVGLTIGALQAAPASVAAPVATRSAPAPSGPLPTAFPNYGRSKGMPIAGASAEDLSYYAAGARRSIADPAKARWHANEKALLAAIEAEQGQSGGSSRPSPSERFPSPPSSAPSQPSMFRNDDPPPPGDNDIPF